MHNIYTAIIVRYFEKNSLVMIILGRGSYYSVLGHSYQITSLPRTCFEYRAQLCI